VEGTPRIPSLWSLCRKVILRSGATKNLLFGFVVSEHHADSTRVPKKSRSFARAQDDTGTIFGLRYGLLTGKDKGRGDGVDRFPSTPISAFPHQGGKEVQVRFRDMPPFSSSVGKRKLMNHPPWRDFGFLLIAASLL
jgi:hypothetical protein